MKQLHMFFVFIMSEFADQDSDYTNNAAFLNMWNPFSSAELFAPRSV